MFPVINNALARVSITNRDVLVPLLSCTITACCDSRERERDERETFHIWKSERFGSLQSQKTELATETPNLATRRTSEREICWRSCTISLKKEKKIQKEWKKEKETCQMNQSPKKKEPCMNSQFASWTTQERGAEALMEAVDVGVSREWSVLLF